METRKFYGLSVLFLWPSLGLFQLYLFVGRNRCGSWTYVWTGIDLTAGLICGQELYWQLDLRVARNRLSFVWPGLLHQDFFSWTYLLPGIGVAAGLICGQESVWQLDVCVARN